MKHWKEHLTFASLVIGLIGTLISTYHSLPQPLAWFIILLLIIGLGSYVFFRRVPSRIDPQQRIELYPANARLVANAISSLAFLALVFGWIPYAYIHYHAPNIQAVLPESPRPGDRIKIVGSNFRDGVVVSFAGLERNRFYRRSENLIEMELPETAVSGPVTVTNKGLISRSTTYPWLNVDSSPILALISEGTSVLGPDNKTTTLLFSAQNTSSATNVTVYDLVINVLAFREWVAHEGVARISLGVAAVFDGGNESRAAIEGINSDLRRGYKPTVTLFDGKLVVRLKPKESDSFTVRLLLPYSSGELTAVFSLVAYYYDDTAKRHISYSDKIYWAETYQSDQLGRLIKIRELPWNVTTFQTLRENGLEVTPRALENRKPDN